MEMNDIGFDLVQALRFDGVEYQIKDLARTPTGPQFEWRFINRDEFYLKALQLRPFLVETKCVSDPDSGPSYVEYIYDIEPQTRYDIPDDDDGDDVTFVEFDVDPDQW